MCDTRVQRSGSSPWAGTALRLAFPLLVLGTLPASAAAQAAGGSFDGTSPAAGSSQPRLTASSLFEPPSGVEGGDDVGSLPSYWEGDDGLFWHADPGATAQHPLAVSGDELPQRPVLALRGRPAAVLAAVTAASGRGLVLVHELPGGELRLEFHGDVVAGIDASLLASGAVRAELVVGELFAPAQAAAHHGGAWSQPFPLSGGTFEIPRSALFGHGPSAGGIGFGAIGSMQESYLLRLATHGGQVWAAQSGL